MPLAPIRLDENNTSKGISKSKGWFIARTCKSKAGGNSVKNLNWLTRPANYILCAMTLILTVPCGISLAETDSHRHQSRRDWHRKATEFRSVAREEIRQIPALHTPMENLSNIQTRRNTLQKERQALASQTGSNRQTVLKQFHTLLQQDMKLADQSREISHQIVKNMPEIKKQIQQRRQTLTESLPSAGQDTTATAEIRRRIRYIDFIQHKLNDINHHPERIDLLARMLRGAPRHEFPPPSHTTTNTQNRVSNLQKRRESLERQLREIDLEIRALEQNQLPDQ